MSEGNLELALRIKADLEQAIGQVKALRDSIDDVTKTTAASAKQSTANASAIQNQADAAEKAAAKSEVLAEATAQQSDHAAAAAANTEKLARLLAEEAAAAEQTTLATGELTAAEITRAKQTQEARESAAGAAAAEIAQKAQLKAAVTDVAAAELLYAKIDPAAGKLAQLDALELQLAKLSKTGVVGAEDFAVLSTKLTATRVALTEVGEAEQGVVLNARAMKEGTTILSEAASGNFGRIRQSAFSLANATGVLSGIFTATGAAIVSFAAILGGLGLAYYKGYEQEQEMNKALILTGNYASVTRGQMDSLAQAVGSVDGKFDEAYQATTKLVESGKITGNVLDNATRSAVNYAELTGKSIDQAVATMVKIGEDPVHAVRELDSSLHFLTGTQYDQIKAMEKAGDDAGVTATAFELLRAKTDSLIEETKKQEGTLEALFDRWTKGLGIIKQSLLEIGKDGTLEAELADAKEQFAYFQKVASNPISNAIGLKGVYTRDAQEELAKILSLTKQINAQNNTLNAQAAAADVDTKYKKATDDLDRMSISVDKNAAKQAKLNKLYEDYRAIEAHNPNDPRLTNGSLETLSADIEDEYKQPKARKNNGIDRAELSADVAATRDALNALNDAYRNSEQILEAQHKAGLVSDAAYFGGKLKDIDDLETAELAQLEKEKANVATHGKTAADRIRIDQQVASIDAQITKVHADAVAKRAEIDAADQANQARRQTQLNQLTGEFLKATGQPGEAALLELHAKYDAMLARMVTEGDTAGAAIVRGLIDVGQAQVQLQDLDRVVSSALAEQQRALKGIDDQRRAGLLSDGQAQQQIVQEHQTTIAVLQQQIPVLQQLANDYHLPGAVEALQKVKDEIADLSITTNQYLEAFGQGLNSGLGEAIDGLFDRTLSLGGAVKVVLRDIAKQFEQLAINELSQRITASVGSLFHVGGDAAGASATGTAITAASAAAAPVLGAGIETGAATGALTLGGGIETGGVAAGTTIATAMTIAGTEVAAQIAIAMAAGSASNSISTGLAAFGGGGFATGGLVTGPGTETSDSILVRLSTGEHVTNAAAVRHYGADMMAAINARRFPRFADGGFVGTISPRLRLSDRGTTQASVQNHMRVYLLQNEDELAQRLAQHPVMEKAIVAVAGDNGEAIRASW